MTNKHLNPHDRLFRSLMSDKNVANEFFEKHLPIDIKKQVQLNSLKLQGNSYIGDNLRMQVTDLPLAKVLELKKKIKSRTK